MGTQRSTLGLNLGKIYIADFLPEKSKLKVWLFETDLSYVSLLHWYATKISDVKPYKSKNMNLILRD